MKKQRERKARKSGGKAKQSEGKVWGQSKEKQGKEGEKSKQKAARWCSLGKKKRLESGSQSSFPIAPQSLAGPQWACANTIGAAGAGHAPGAGILNKYGKQQQPGQGERLDPRPSRESAFRGC